MGRYFSREIFIAAGGEVSDARVRFPDRTLVKKSENSNIAIRSRTEIGDVMYLSGIADSNEAMEAEFPTGAYEFTFSTPGGDVTEQRRQF